jgi:hypothetical protein
MKKKQPKPPTYIRQPACEEWRDIPVAILGDAAQLDPYGCVVYLLERAPKASAAELASELERCGGPSLTKATMRRWREAIKAGHTDAAPEGAELGDTEEGSDNTPAGKAREAIKIGDAIGAKRWLEAAKLQQEAGIPDRDEDPDAPDWSRISDAEFSALRAIMRRAKGEVADEEDLWWRALFARVPDPPIKIHPAHLPLPKGSPKGAILSPTKTKKGLVT